MSEELPLEKLWDAIMTRAEQTGQIPIKDKVWVEKFGNWTLIVNGKAEAHDYEGLRIAPYNAAVFWGDFPWGSFNAFEGTIGVGAAANLDQFLKDIAEMHK